MLDAGALIEKYRSKAVLIDTNLLVLLLVGLVNKQRIPEFKRTKNFTIDDFELLRKLLASFGALATTPHVLSQVSDLATLAGRELQIIRERFASLIQEMDEHYDASRAVVTDALFHRLGLADTAIAAVSSREGLVLTSDQDLYLALQQRGADALNFNHVRALGWT